MVAGGGQANRRVLLGKTATAAACATDAASRARESWSYQCARQGGTCLCEGTVSFGFGTLWSPPQRARGSLGC